MSDTPPPINYSHLVQRSLLQEIDWLKEAKRTLEKVSDEMAGSQVREILMYIGGEIALREYELKVGERLGVIKREDVTLE